MSFGNIIGGMLQQGLSRSSQSRLQTGAGSLGSGGDLERMLGSFLSKQRGGSAAGRTGMGASGQGGFGDMARDFLGSKQAGGMSGAQIGGAGAALGAVFGGGLKGAAKGGAMALLGTMALKALREHQAGGGSAGTATAGAAGALPEPTEQEVEALTSASAERLVLRAMIGAAQVDGHIDEAEMEKILGHMAEGEVTEEERRAAREEANRPVDVASLGREVDRPEVATEVYLGALLAIEVDTEAERDYLRRLASALRLDRGVVDRLHRLTGAPVV